MLPQKQIVYSTQRRKRQENVVFPTEVYPDGNFFHDMKPLLSAFRLLGLLPFRCPNSGKPKQSRYLVQN